MGVVFDNTTVHFRDDGTFLYTTEEEIEALRTSVSAAQSDISAAQSDISAAQSDISDLQTGSTASWTPGLSFGGGTTGITYTTQTGTYTQIGKVVFYSGRILLSSKGSSTGIALITGLPVAALNDAGVGSFVSYTNMSSMSAPVISASTGTTQKIRNQTATNQTNVTDTNFANNTDIYFSGFYLTS
jgi:hypothetical protein